MASSVFSPTRYLTNLVIYKMLPLINLWLENCISSVDFNLNGESVATIDRYGVCLISNLNTDQFSFNLNLESEGSLAFQLVSSHKLHYFYPAQSLMFPWITWILLFKQAFTDFLPLLAGYHHCRWTTNAEEPILFLKYDRNKLNILDVEKKRLTLLEPVKVEERRRNNVWEAILAHCFVNYRLYKLDWCLQKWPKSRCFCWRRRKYQDLWSARIWYSQNFWECPLG